MLDFSLSTPAIFAILGCLLIAWDISKKNKNPWTVITGLVCIALMGFTRLVTSPGILSLATGVFTDMAMGLWSGAGLLLFRRAKAKPFVILGVLALGLAFLLGSIGKVFNVETTNADTFLLELGPDDSIEEINAELLSRGLVAEKAFPTVSLSMDEDLAQVYIVSGTRSNMQAAMRALRLDTENIDHVEWNEAFGLDLPANESSLSFETTTGILGNDPLAGDQWALDAINGHDVHHMLQDMTPVRKARVAILDTGVDGGHEDITGVFESTPGNVDKHGHGTHCAGIAGAATNNSIGMASLNWNGEYIDILSYQALGNDGMGSVEMIAQAIIDATQNNADVISMSLGGFALAPPRVVKKAVNFAIERNAIVVAAAGNSNQDAKNHMPSNIEGVITVAATDQNGNKAKFSNTNTSLTRPIAAPGVDIVSLIPNQDYGPKSGTSMATPVVSGLLGIMRAMNPDLSAKEAYAILHETGETLDDSPRIGRLINAREAVNKLACGMSRTASAVILLTLESIPVQ
ncbi:MAG: S8 family serine peptidase [Bacteroidota bacterium]